MSRRQRQPMPVLDAMSQPGRFVFLPPRAPGGELRRQPGQQFIQEMILDDQARRVWVGAVPDIKSLLPESLVQRAKRLYNSGTRLDDPEGVDRVVGQEVVDSFGPQRLPFPVMWIEFAVHHRQSPDELAPLAAYVMETDYGYGIAFFRLMPDGHVYSTVLIEQVSVDEQGKVTGMQAEWAVNQEHRKGMPEPDDEDDFAMVNISMPVLWAIGLMNCRNVHTVEVTPEPRRTKKQRRPRRAGLSYHTIVLPSVRYSPASAVNPEPGTLSDQPLHMVRGHTKTYTAEAPLLGKHVGTFWWGYQVRGSKDNGEIVSDYKMTS